VAGLFGFGVGICLYYGRIGFMPLDHSIVFDGAYRVISGQVPLRDFDLPSGVVPILLQAVGFKLLGLTWFSYCLHAAFINGLFCLTAYGFLRLLGGGRLLAFFYAALSGVVFYPPIGVPYLEQHAFFFTLAALVLTLAAARSLNGRRAFLLGALVPVALAAAALSKQIPTALALPLVPLLLLRSGARQRRWAALGVAAGVVVVTVLLLGALPLFHIPPARVVRDLFDLPGALGRARFVKMIRTHGDLAHAVGRQLVAWGSAAAGSTALLSAVLGLVGAAGVAVALRRRDRGRAVFFAGALADAATAAGLLLTCALFALLTLHNIQSALAYLFVSLGTLHVVLAKLVAPRAVAGGEGKVAWREPVALVFGGVLVLLSAGDAVRFNREVNATRVAIRVVPGPAPAGEAPLPPALAFMVWAPPVHGAYPVRDLDAVVAYFASHPGNFFLLGDSSILYALTSRPSVSPALWLHPGLTFPRPVRPEFLDYQEELMADLARYDVRYIVLEGGETQLGVDLDTFPRLRRRVRRHTCGEEGMGTFTVVNLCAGVWSRRQAFSKSFHAMPSWRTAARTVPSLRSRPPQSGTTVARSVSGFSHFRWDPPPRRGISWQPSWESLRLTCR